MGHIKQHLDIMYLAYCVCDEDICITLLATGVVQTEDGAPSTWVVGGHVTYCRGVVAFGRSFG